MARRPARPPGRVGLGPPAREAANGPFAPLTARHAATLRRRTAAPRLPRAGAEPSSPWRPGVAHAGRGPSPAGPPGWPATAPPLAPRRDSSAGSRRLRCPAPPRRCPWPERPVAQAVHGERRDPAWRVVEPPLRWPGAARPPGAGESRAVSAVACGRSAMLWAAATNLGSLTGARGACTAPRWARCPLGRHVRCPGLTLAPRGSPRRGAHRFASRPTLAAGWPRARVAAVPPSGRGLRVRMWPDPLTPPAQSPRAGRREALASSERSGRS